MVFSSSSFSREELIAYNEFCRCQTPPIGFVLAESRGVLGFCFADYSPCHIAEDLDAVAEFRILTKLTQVTETSAVIHVVEPHVSTSFVIRDNIAFRCFHGNQPQIVCELEAILSSQSIQVRLPVHALEERARVTAQLCAATHLRKAKQRWRTKHVSFRERIIDPGTITLPVVKGTDLQACTFGIVKHVHTCRAEVLYSCVFAVAKQALSAHMAMQAMYSFRQDFGTFPQNNNTDHVQQCMELLINHLALVMYFPKYTSC